MAKNQTKPAAKAEANKAEKAKKEVVKPAPQPTGETSKSSNGMIITVTILATVLVCGITLFIVLLCTGVIRFGDSGQGEREMPGIEEREDDTKGGKTGKDNGKSDDGLVDNPYTRVAAKGRLVEVGDLEFYLPNKFKAGGKNKDGAYTYNLEDDDGWAQVLVFAEKSSLTPAKYLQKISSYLEITDTDYEMNGTSWVQAENGVALAYATKLDGKIYAVYYSVKLDSDATSEAMQMIPKTLYMKKIEQN